MSTRDLRQRVAYMQDRRPIASPRGARASAVYEPPPPTPPPPTPSAPRPGAWVQFDLGQMVADIADRLETVGELMRSIVRDVQRSKAPGRVHRHEKRNPDVYAARSVHRGVNPAADRRMATERNRERRRAARRARREGNRA